MNIELVLQEYIDEINKSDFCDSSLDIIMGLLMNVFKDHQTVSPEILIQEIQIRLKNLKEYNSHSHEEDVA